MTLILAVGYFYSVTSDCWRGITDCTGMNYANTLHEQPAPFRYRIIEPAIQQVLVPSGALNVALIVDAVVHAVFVALLLPGLWLWLRRWLPPDRAMVGVALLALAFMLCFQYYMPFGTTIIEMVLLTYALVVIDTTLPLYALLLAAAALNRETSLLLVAVYAAWHGRTGIRGSLVLLGLWAGITIGLHLALGSAPHIYGLADTFRRNEAMIAEAVMYNLPFAVLWGMVVLQYRCLNPLFKRFTWIALVYGVAVLAGAMWAEVRVLLPLLPMLMPVVLIDGEMLEPMPEEPSHR